MAVFEARRAGGAVDLVVLRGERAGIDLLLWRCFEVWLAMCLGLHLCKRTLVREKFNQPRYHQKHRIMYRFEVQ